MRKNVQLTPEVRSRLQLKTIFVFALAGIAISIIIGVIAFVFFNIGKPDKATAANTTYNTAASGLWSSSGTWTGTVPANDPVPQNSTLNINTSHEVVVPTGENLHLQQNTTVNLDGTLIIKGDFTMDQGADIIVSSTGTLIIMGNYSADHHLLLENGGIVLIMGSITTGIQTDIVNNGQIYSDTAIPIDSGNPQQPLSEVQNNSTLVQILNDNGLLFTVLPVELLSFKAENEETEVTLVWATASETNNDFFSIERSIDGKDFEVIGEVEGAGNSTVRVDYSFVDEKPLNGKSYYRLKQTDYDGQFEYFDILVVQRDAVVVDIVKVGPNPFTDIVNITFNSENSGSVELKITNSRGVVVFSDVTLAHAGINEYQFNGGNALGKDIYLLSIAQNGNWSKTFKLIKR